MTPEGWDTYGETKSWHQEEAKVSLTSWVVSMKPKQYTKHGLETSKFTAEIPFLKWHLPFLNPLEQRHLLGTKY